MTSPITITAGFAMPAPRTAAARWRSGVVTTRCRGVQPSDTTAHGVSAPSPPASSASVIAARWSIAISRTRVIPLRAAWTAVTDDRRKARIVAVEVVGVSERLERLRHETRQALAQLTADNAMSLTGSGVRLRLDPVLTARFLMGGVVEVLLEWINGDLNASVDEVVEHFTALFTAAAYASVARNDPAG